VRRTKLWAIAGISIVVIWHSFSLLSQSATGAISGTVRLTDGTPVAGMRVAVTEATPTNASKFYASINTDSSGNYTLGNLPPGSYYVKAGGCDTSWIECPVDSPLFVYHPGTMAKGSATVVVLGPATEIKDKSFKFTADELRALREKSSSLQKQAEQLWRIKSSSTNIEVSEWDSFEAMHNDYVAQFVATPGMGSGRLGAMIMSLDSRKRIRISKTQDDGKSAGVWAVASLELVGIAKHETPVVFSKLAHGTYGLDPRKLSDFDNRAISQLRDGEETVYRRDVDGILLIGAIRAGDSCLGCHVGSHPGDLLGAFRYTLQTPRP
jgi:hypothetical protein